MDERALMWRECAAIAWFLKEKGGDLSKDTVTMLHSRLKFLMDRVEGLDNFPEPY